MGSKSPMEDILHGLNSAQCAAVTSPASVLQILAPPGSGKTRTLTARVAYLLKHDGYLPNNIIVATFTVKAAREMKERLGKLLGNGLEARLVLGTFHSISRRYLVRYGYLIGIQKGFGIADSSDSLGIIKRIIKRQKFTMDPSTARNRVSSHKARGGHQIEVNPNRPKTIEAQEFAQLYEEYESALDRSNLLDYDDLLLRCVDLLEAYPKCVSNVEAVLIDEFQDTNVVQFKLMKLFANQRNRVTIVGDPDQSIYGFRYAESKNLERMRRQYPETLEILLEENYRSSGAILLSALEVIQQDVSRPAKPLLPTHIVGIRPVLRLLPSADVEALWIVLEIKRARAMTGDVLSLNDFAILLRSASLSRHIELALGRFGVPYRMVGGNRFFDRAEVKVVVDYLRVISQPDNNDALARIINVPPRRIGDKTIKKLVEEADLKKISLWTLIRSHRAGGCMNTKLTKATDNSMGTFYNLILTARKKLSGNESGKCSLVDLVEHILCKLSFQDYLQRSHPDDHDTRWANVQELTAQATEFSNSVESCLEDDEALSMVPGLEQHTDLSMADVLSKFLANLALSSEINDRATDASSQNDQVTISTIHAAKGLEWPAVFVPGSFEGSIPHSRSEDMDEERRLLYVAMTRAQALLYLSYPAENSQKDTTTLSSFLSTRGLRPHLERKGPSFKYDTVRSVCHILGRDCPSEVQIIQNSQGVATEEDELCLPDVTQREKGAPSWVDSEGDDYRPQSKNKKRRIDLTQREPRLAVHTTMTTMHNTSMFSVASTSMTGFVSAGAHLRNISQQELNRGISRQARRSPEQAKVTSALVPVATGMIGKAGNNTSIERRQRTLAGFVCQRATIEKGVEAKKDLQNLSEIPSEADGLVSQSTQMTAESVCSRPLTSQTHRLPPSATTADITRPSVPRSDVVRFPRTAPVTVRSTPATLEHLPASKVYHFLSSPPPSLQGHVFQTEVPSLCAVEHELSSEAGKLFGAGPAFPEPHERHDVVLAEVETATVSRMASKRTLGVRRSMKGWAHRGGVGVPDSARAMPDLG